MLFPSCLCGPILIQHGHYPVALACHHLTAKHLPTLAQAAVVFLRHHMDKATIINEMQGSKEFQSRVLALGENTALTPERMIEGNGLNQRLSRTETVSEIMQELSIMVILVQDVFSQMLRDAPPGTSLIELPFISLNRKMQRLPVSREAQ